MIHEYEIREVGPDEAAALFILHAAIGPADADQLLPWTQELEAKLETGARAWAAVRGRRLAGYGLIDSLPGLPGVCDLSGGVAVAYRRRGLGGRLLGRIREAAREMGVAQLSCRVERLEDEAAAFLLHRGFSVEHEECLLELTALEELPHPAPDPTARLISLPREQAIPAFLQVYGEAFDGKPWSQPYTADEVDQSLIRAEDLLFIARDDRPIGVVWREQLPDGRGRIEPLAVSRDHQGRGHGRALLLAALHDFRRQRVGVVEIGLWRVNAVAMNLYKSLGFSEVANWYYLACSLRD